MAEAHDKMLAHYRAKLVRRNFKIEGKSPFVDYRPDIFATKGKIKIFVEVEIPSTLHSNHTLEQLEIMHRYLVTSRSFIGVLLVPKKAKQEALFLIQCLFGDKKINIEVSA